MAALRLGVVEPPEAPNSGSCSRLAEHQPSGKIRFETEFPAHHLKFISVYDFSCMIVDDSSPMI
jgi:hypothetical protein